MPKVATEGGTPSASEVTPPPEAPSLLVVGESGVFSRPLPPNGEVTIGRSEECDVAVDDPKMSRRHLLIRTRDTGTGETTRQGSSIEVVDLGSANGTLLDDLPLAPNVAVSVSVGATLTAASTVIIVRTRGQASRAPGLVSHEELRARIVAECDRAAATRDYGEAFALVRVHVPGARDTDALETVLGDSLRKKDVVAAVIPGMYVVLLLETSAARADAVASRIASLLDSYGMIARLQVAAYPRDGDTPSLLAKSEGSPPSRRGAGEAEGAAAASGTDRVVFAGNAMRAIDAQINEIASAPVDIVLLGEPGVGKETIARVIHARSPRSGKPFLYIDCSAITELPPELIGADDSAPFAALEGGTVFFHEIGELSLELQASLLQALERRDRRGSGFPDPETRGVRFMSSSTTNLEAACFQGRFLGNLLRRLDGTRIVVPPLRARSDEIEPLAKAFVRTARRAIGTRQEIRISAPALLLLKHHSWPQNARELKGVIERAVLLVSGDAITLEHLPCEQLAPVVSVRDPWLVDPKRGARATSRVA